MAAIPWNMGDPTSTTGDAAIRGAPWARRREPSDAATHAPTDAASARRRARLVALAQMLDNRWVIPGTSYRVGLDAIIGLVPGVGDLAMTLVSGYIVVEAARLGATKGQLARMVLNLAIEAAAGTVPVLGDLFDAGFKANVRNLRLMGIEAGTPTPAR
jgi:hypothetical protein